jgi:hypothetical protein
MIKIPRAAGFLFTLCAANAFGASLSFDPTSAGPLAVGNTVTLSVRGSDFASVLDGGGVNLTFDPTIVNVNRVTVDAGTWEFFSSSGTTENPAGRVNDIIFNSLQPRTGSLPIFTVEFLAVAPGDAQIGMTESTINPFASGGVRYSPAVDFGTASIRVAPVPLPIAFSLLLSGLAGFGMCKRQRHGAV